MTSRELKHGRANATLTQVEAAARLGVSQPYLSLMERGGRSVTARVARVAAKLYRLPPTVLPLEGEHAKHGGDGEKLVRQLAALGYPGYRHFRPGQRVNPALVVLRALSQDDLDARVVQALPWVLSEYPELDWDWLVPRAKLQDLQNRLGFLVGVARRLTESRGDRSGAERRLAEVEQQLERARLATETTLGREAMPLAERNWLREHRPHDARHWNVLTSLTPEQLPYAP